jgi:hypothetical protein
MARNGHFPHRLAGVEGLQEVFIFNARFVYPLQIRCESPRSGAGELSNLLRPGSKPVRAKTVQQGLVHESRKCPPKTLSPLSGDIEMVIDELVAKLRAEAGQLPRRHADDLMDEAASLLLAMNEALEAICDEWDNPDVVFAAQMPRLYKQAKILTGAASPMTTGEHHIGSIDATLNQGGPGDMR